MPHKQKFIWTTLLLGQPSLGAVPHHTTPRWLIIPQEAPFQISNFSLPTYETKHTFTTIWRTFIDSSRQPSNQDWQQFQVYSISTWWHSLCFSAMLNSLPSCTLTHSEHYITWRTTCDTARREHTTQQSAVQQQKGRLRTTYRYTINKEDPVLWSALQKCGMQKVNKTQC